MKYQTKFTNIMGKIKRTFSKEFIIKHEKKESLSIQDTKEKTGREAVLSKFDENV